MSPRRLAIAAGLLACPVIGALAAQVTVVSQAARAFSITSAHIHRGDAIHFTNDDRFDHQVFVDSPAFKFETAEQAPGESKDVTFTAAGLFDVQCHIHPRMHLAVTVE